AALTSVLGPWLLDNYRSYMDMGPGGLPYNAYGWLIAVYRKSFSRETRSTAAYDADPYKEAFLTEADRAFIPERRGDRPATTWHVFPSRQLDRFSPPEVQPLLVEAFDKIAADNAHLISVVPSRFERLHPAIVIGLSRTFVQKASHKARGEICHIHRGKDFSLHICMASQDCKLVIERGWGERHPLAGSHFLPKEYMMLYAPRSEEEVEVIKRCIKAAIGFNLNTHDV
ncbi:hypothetical protein CONPUDRAFT_21818, partial [Coniophora puteana RWD-64-598 SS2]